MVLQSSSLDAVFHALSDPTRRVMLRSLALGERNIGELAAPFSMSFAAASKHVRVLERAKLVSRRKEGRAYICRLESGPLKPAYQWIGFFEGFWDGRFIIDEGGGEV
jgi:DNA-binding transcriptional ArsR family regulator